MNQRWAALVVGLFMVQPVLAQSPDIILNRVLGNSKVQEARASADKDIRYVMRDGSQKDAIVVVAARFDSLPAAAALGEISRELDSAGIATKAGVLFVALNGPEGKAKAALQELLEGDLYRGRVKSCVVIQSSGENVVYGPPNSIGSTIVQYGLQSVQASGGDPEYQAGSGLLDVPVQLKIPAVALGAGEDKPSAKGIKSILSAVIALAGLQ